MFNKHFFLILAETHRLLQYNAIQHQTTPNEQWLKPYYTDNCEM